MLSSLPRIAIDFRIHWTLQSTLRLLSEDWRISLLQLIIMGGSMTYLAQIEGKETKEGSAEDSSRMISTNLDAQTVAMIQTQVNRIVQSHAFLRSARMQRFLRFAVERALKGMTDSLKENHIAREVFDKAESFNPGLDPIVRVEVGRFRSKLSKYYAEEGTEDPILILFHKRSYIPAFKFRHPNSPTQRVFPHTLGTIAVLPFTDLNPIGDQDHFCSSLTEELTNLANRLTELQVVARTSALSFRERSADARNIGADLCVDALIEGSILRDEGKVRVFIALVDTRSGYQMWSTIFDLRTNGNFDSQEMIAHKAVKLLNEKLQELRHAELQQIHSV